jgi:glycosyltransferase involved in cell wall biosynthesis
MEGQPISILEAMATKNVIITTDHAGIPDIFSSGVHGFYVDKKSSKSISETLEYLSVQKEEVKKIAENNKVYFLKNFTLSNFKKNLLEIIEK